MKEDLVRNIINNQKSVLELLKIFKLQWNTDQDKDQEL